MKVSQILGACAETGRLLWMLMRCGLLNRQTAVLGGYEPDRQVTRAA